LHRHTRGWIGPKTVSNFAVAQGNNNNSDNYDNNNNNKNDRYS